MKVLVKIRFDHLDLNHPLSETATVISSISTSAIQSIEDDRKSKCICFYWVSDCMYYAIQNKVQYFARFNCPKYL